jgi:hypothetical protein
VQCHDLSALSLPAIRNANPKIAVIVGLTAGLVGAVLSDFSMHKVYDDGGESKQCPIKHIARGNPGVVQTLEPHAFRTGDFVRIEGV